MVGILSLLTRWELKALSSLAGNLTVVWFVAIFVSQDRMMLLLNAFFAMFALYVTLQTEKQLSTYA